MHRYMFFPVAWAAAATSCPSVAAGEAMLKQLNNYQIRTADPLLVNATSYQTIRPPRTSLENSIARAELGACFDDAIPSPGRCVVGPCQTDLRLARDFRARAPHSDLGIF